MEQAKTVECVRCHSKFDVKRSPLKGYKITLDGCVCDACYSENYKTAAYEYGCGSEFYGGYDNTEAAVEVIYKLNRLRNALVEIDRFERTEYRKLVSDPATLAEIENHEAVKESLLTAIRLERQRQRTRRVSKSIDPAIKAQISIENATLKTLHAQNKTYATKMKAANRAAIDQLRTECQAKIDAACESSGIVQTSWRPMLAKFKTSSMKAKTDGAMLQFHRFDGSGIISVPFTNGLPVADVWSTDEKGGFQIAPSLMTTHPKEKRRQCRIVIGRNGRKPIWLTVPVTMHRSLPADADIRHVEVVRNVVAGKPVWKVCITVRTVKNPATKNTRKCGINLGWRRLDAGVRVATVVDDSGKHDFLVLPHSDFEQFEKLEGLVSVMKRAANEVQAKLVTRFAKLHPPSVIAEDVKTLAQWRSPGRLVHLLKVWTANRFAGDNALFKELEEWFFGIQPKPNTVWNGHKHLYEYHANLNDQLQRKRREVYRVFAAKLAKEYGTVYLPSFDIRAVAETPEVDTDQAAEYDDMARYRRPKVAVSTLRQAIKNAAAREGLKCKELDSSHITHICVVCDHTLKFDARKELVACCPQCKTVLDQDVIGAKNTLDRGCMDDDGTLPLPNVA